MSMHNKNVLELEYEYKYSNLVVVEDFLRAK